MITLRPAVPADAVPLAALARQTFLDTFVHGFQIPYPEADLAVFLEKSYDPEVLRRSLSDPSRWWLVAERDGALVAFAEAGPCGLPHPEVSPDHGELKRLYLDRTAQGQGLGLAMLKQALAWLERRAHGPLWIGVWSGNLRAQRLYTNQGFVKVGEYDYPVGSWNDREFILRRAARP
ncbi:MAG: GNAT family N-acetyltransferase [Polyangiaceae bacterium]|nr:GNAT family N-acetyltransferase [Polyangiaceae bacterium]